MAIDPRDPQIIYAGTWHLPWKTSDGGLHWSSIKQGVIDDSDVFSIILDRGNPQTVFASACSGIYQSDDGGKLFRKVQGMPDSARRTRVLEQDPQDADTLYAGTTEGLWKTTDGGQDFRLISPPDFILNGVLVDPRNSGRVLIATDRGGRVCLRRRRADVLCVQRGLQPAPDHGAGGRSAGAQRSLRERAERQGIRRSLPPPRRAMDAAERGAGQRRGLRPAALSGRGNWWRPPITACLCWTPAASAGSRAGCC